MNDKRINRISEEVKKVVSELIFREIKDPRISGLPSVNRVIVTKDLKTAKIYISVLGNEEEKTNTIKGLENAKGFVRSEIGKRISLRHVPEPIFYLDNSIEEALYMTQLIEKVNKESTLKEGSPEDNKEKENE